MPESDAEDRAVPRISMAGLSLPQPSVRGRGGMLVGHVYVHVHAGGSCVCARACWWVTCMCTCMLVGHVYVCLCVHVCARG